MRTPWGVGSAQGANVRQVTGLCGERASSPWRGENLRARANKDLSIYVWRYSESMPKGERGEGRDRVSGGWGNLAESQTIGLRSVESARGSPRPRVPFRTYVATLTETPRKVWRCEREGTICLQRSSSRWLAGAPTLKGAEPSARR